GIVKVPDRILLYGIEGIGKSTFAANAPKPIFIEPESDGTARINTNRLPAPETWGDVIDAVDSLTTEQHDYQTLVVDTLDAAEAMLWRFICKRDDKSSIEAYGYGKGYVAALDEWRVFMARLEKLRRERRMGIILIAHSWIKPFKNPEGDDFDRYEMKLHPRAGGLLREWCDAVLFANYEVLTSKENDKAKAKGVTTDNRIVHTRRTAAFDAKNRFGLPESLALNYAAFVEASKANDIGDAEALVARINGILEQLADQELTDKVNAAVGAASGNAADLNKIMNRINATLRAKEG
ncbi:MAG TPA: ATP-binding protein, partial [Polyangia bacterium]|nr:ATP-binding protein [Polyangia bacterium]